ncbi:hypothetical protein AKJ53_01825, partial [candidate division MSBL1 archaeon SCGC-AAA382F02]
DVVGKIYLLDNRGEWASQQILSEEVLVNGSAKSSLPPGNEDNRSMNVQLGDIDAGDSKTIQVTQVVRVDATNLQIDPSQTAGQIPSQYKKYTKSVDYLWQSDDSKIQSKASELTAGENNYYSKAIRILNWVENHLTYQVQSIEHGAIWAYEHNFGDCTEYSNLFIALARAAGIPAKAVSGYLYEAGSEDISTIGHQWTIFYLPSVGWVPADLTYNPPVGQFGNLTNDHVIELTSDGSNWTKEPSGLSPPSPYVSYSYRGKDPNLGIEPSGTITRVVGVDLSVTPDIEAAEDTLHFDVEIRNSSSSHSISNVKVELDVDNTYFTPPSEKNLDDINPGTQRYVSFEIPVKKSVENSPITTVVTYEAGDYGTFEASETVSTTINISQQVPYELPFSWIMVAVAIGVVVSLIGAILIFFR